ncbi:MAG: C25 family cysteine peptidase [Verrucomicrobiia bacterium]
MVGIVSGLSGCLIAGTALAADPKFHSVLASADVSDSARITLNWPADPDARSYAVSRKPAESAAWNLLQNLPGEATRFVDSAVAQGSVYEYQIIKTAADYTGYGYLRAAIEAPLVDRRGTVILVVARTHADALAVQLEQFKRDLVGDGWTVLRRNVSPHDSPPAVKAVIKSAYDADPANVRAVLLFGDVVVPYSGLMAADGHENHEGAWPADVYYADMHGTWTDSTVNSTTAERDRNWNIPGDGRFDQNAPPGGATLEIGRVDLSNMTCFSNKTPPRSERDLLRQYLVKNHQFRHGRLAVERRGLICDNFADKGRDPIAGSAWRNFPGFFGAENIVEVGWSNYFPRVTSESFLWTFGSGGGQDHTCTGIGSSDDFALSDSRVVFTMWLGSYFGDWDTESNFLRAPLGSSIYTLTSTYSGFPQWLYHPMALGETIGYCARLTQNNIRRGAYPPLTQGASLVHIALHGDPTLRMHPVLPASDLKASLIGGNVQLTWTASPERDLRGYHVYRAASMDESFVRITGDIPVTAAVYVDENPGPPIYMVRAIKLERSGSGTYLNASQGVFATVAPGAPAPNVQITRLEPQRLRISVSGAAGQPFAIESSPDLTIWEPVSPADGPEAIEDSNGNPQRFYRAKTLPAP